MDKIAVISDIHGNIPALDAVLDDIGMRSIKRIICLGDIVGKGPHSDIAVDMVRNHCETVIMGNWEDYVLKSSGSDEIAWHQRRLGSKRMRYIKNLPLFTEFNMSGRFVRLFHASPQGIYKRIQPWDPVEERLKMFENTAVTGNGGDVRKPDTAGYGDVHNAYMQNIKGKTLFNVGSVGNPLDITQASYGILEGIYDSPVPASFSIQLVRVPYDIELAVRQAKMENMPLQDAYEMELRTARYRGSKG